MVNNIGANNQIPEQNFVARAAVGDESATISLEDTMGHVEAPPNEAKNMGLLFDLLFGPPHHHHHHYGPPPGPWFPPYGGWWTSRWPPPHGGHHGPPPHGGHGPGPVHGGHHR